MPSGIGSRHGGFAAGASSQDNALSPGRRSPRSGGWRTGRRAARAAVLLPSRAAHGGLQQEVAPVTEPLPIHEEIARRAHVRSLEEYQRLYRESLDDPAGFWGEQAEGARLVPPLADRRSTATSSEVDFALVLGRPAQRLLQLRRPPPRRARRHDRDHLGRGRARRLPARHLSRAQAQGLPGRQRAAPPRRAQGRPRLHLHADDPRDRLRDAGLRAHRRRALGGLRRVLSARVAARPHPRRALPACSSRPTRGCAAASASRSRRPPTRRSRA